MTLSRQLIILVATLVVMLFLGTLAISVYNTRGYLESQLASHAQDAATSLGLSATSHVQSEDQAIVTAMVNAMFHRGDYQRIRFETLSGEPWIERESEVRVDDVPDWFVRSFPLDPPERSATMMSGWRQIGNVLVISHPGLAYRKLWQTTRQMLNLFLASALLVLLVGLMALRLMLRPLKAVERQAEQICDREFPVLNERPFTLEFRRVVEAMNRLSTKVSRMLAESERSATELRQQAFQDPVTGLANRRQFDTVLRQRIDDSEHFASGGLLLIELWDFKRFNQEQGYEAGDQLLVDAARCILDAVADFPGATVAHLAGADFAVLLERVDTKVMEDAAAGVAAAVASLHSLHPTEQGRDVAHVGGAVYTGQSYSELLADADMALREAQRKGANEWVVRRSEDAPTNTRTGSAWRSVIERAIEQQRFSLLRQPVIRCADGRVIHHEIFIRIPDPDDPENEIAAGVFMPLAESGGLAPLVDRAVLERVVIGLEAGTYPGKIAINLSPLSMLDNDFADWLEGSLRHHPMAAARLILEFPEYGVTPHLGRLAELIDRLSPMGIEFSIDHFGKGFSSFAYLRSTKVHFLKIDGSFVREMVHEQDSRFFVRAISDIAHGLDMVVVAESVENAELWDAVKRLGIDAGRGFHLGKPE